MPSRRRCLPSFINTQHQVYLRLYSLHSAPSPRYRADADMYRSIKRAYKNIGRDFKQMQTTDENQALDAFDRAIKYKMAKGARFVLLPAHIPLKFTIPVSLLPSLCRIIVFFLQRSAPRPRRPKHWPPPLRSDASATRKRPPNQRACFKNCLASNRCSSESHRCVRPVGVLCKNISMSFC